MNCKRAIWLLCLPILATLSCQGHTPAADSGAVSLPPETLEGQCPDRLDVATVYLHQMAFEKGIIRGWFVHEKIIDGDEQPFTEAELGSHNHISRIIDDSVAASLGASSSDAPIWLYSAPGSPSCKATPGRYWAHRTGDALMYTEVSRELEVDCDLGFKEGWMLGLRSTEAPSDCRWIHGGRPVPLLKQALAIDFPGTHGQALDPRSCAHPKCDLRFTLDKFATTQLEVFELTVSRVFPAQDIDECEWKVEDQYGLFIRQGGESPGPLSYWEAEGFAGFFEDSRGTAGLVTHTDGLLRLYSAPKDPSSAPKKLMEQQWYRLHEEDNTIRSLGPYCGP